MAVECNIMLNAIRKEGDWSFFQIINSQKTAHTLRASYGMSFLSYLEKWCCEISRVRCISFIAYIFYYVAVSQWSGIPVDAGSTVYNNWAMMYSLYCAVNISHHCFKVNLLIGRPSEWEGGGHNYIYIYTNICVSVYTRWSVRWNIRYQYLLFTSLWVHVIDIRRCWICRNIDICCLI